MTTESQTAAVVLAVYSSQDEAKAALTQLETMQRQGIIELLEAASATKDMDGKIHVQDTADVGTKKGTRRGLVVGGVIGLIFPPSIIAGALAGSAVGALYGHFRDKGFSNKELAQAGEELQPGQTGVIAVLVDRFAERVAQGLDGYAKLDKYLLSADESAAVIATSAESAKSS